MSQQIRSCFVSAILFIIFIGLSVSYSHAQALPASDSSAQNKGQLSLQARSFVMHTINKDSMQDPAAWVIAATVGYDSRIFHHFRAGMSVSVIQNILSDNLIEPDPETNIRNRYEVGLVDVTNPAKKTLVRPENLYLQYRKKYFTVAAGRQLLNTPFINPQDGRMRSTMEEGIWFDLKSRLHWQWQGGWIWRMAPRSTSKWYQPGASIGLYSVGVDVEGLTSRYAGHINSRGIGIAGLTYSDTLAKFQIWNTYAENLMNTTFLQAEKKWKIGKEEFLFLGLQGTAQVSSGQGGNADPQYRYYLIRSRAFVFSSRAAYRHGNLEANLNYTRISNDGRYLLPREWGREPFYTFMARERNEGYGNVHAFSVNIIYSSASNGWYAGIGYGQFRLPNVTDYALNKYGMPSYRQLNLEVRKTLHGAMEGFDAQLLIAGKTNWRNACHAPMCIQNKVNMLNGNFVINYRL